MIFVQTDAMEIKDGSRLIVVILLHRENKGRLSQLRGMVRVRAISKTYRAASQWCKWIHKCSTRVDAHKMNMVQPHSVLLIQFSSSCQQE